MKSLAVSACLLGENCKYSGGNNRLDEKLISKLKEKYNLVPVCPEVLGGLAVPRFPSEIRDGKVINSDGEDVTEAFTCGAKRAFETAMSCNCTVALLKERSPSCGYGEIYDGSFSHKIIPGNGVCAELFDRNGISVFGESKIADLIE